MSPGQFVLKIAFPFLIADQAEKIVHGIAYSFSTLGRPRRHTMDMYGDDARYSQASSTPSPGLRKRLSTNLEVGPVSSSKSLLVSKADCQKMMIQEGRIGFTITLTFAKTNKQNRWLVPVQNAFTSSAAWDTYMCMPYPNHAKLYIIGTYSIPPSKEASLINTSFSFGVDYYAIALLAI